jgi:lysyl-tRNA synthetase class 2
LTEELITEVARNVLGKTELEFRGNKIDLKEWERISFAQLMKENFDIEPEEKLERWMEKLKKKGIKFEGENISRSFVINIIEEMLTPKASKHPVFVTDLYRDFCPLAKSKKDNPALSERFELFIGGLEVANAYSELNDPLEQSERFQAQLKEAKEKTKREIDEDYVVALEYGMPPAGGLGIGIDRLLMLFTNQSSIRDVILFPQLKPESKGQRVRNP